VTYGILYWLHGLQRKDCRNSLSSLPNKDSCSCYMNYKLSYIYIVLSWGTQAIKRLCNANMQLNQKDKMWGTTCCNLCRVCVCLHGCSVDANYCTLMPHGCYSMCLVSRDTCGCLSSIIGLADGHFYLLQTRRGDCAVFSPSFTHSLIGNIIQKQNTKKRALLADSDSHWLLVFNGLCLVKAYSKFAIDACFRMLLFCCYYCT